MALPDVTVSGKLLADPEPAFTDDGHPATYMKVQSADFTKDTQGNWVSKGECTLYVMAQGNYAENATESLRKGDLALIHGRLRLDPGNQYLLIAHSVAVDLRFRTTRHSKDETKAQPQN